LIRLTGEILRISNTLQATEFGFVSEFPQSKTKKSFLDEVREFFAETDGGAVPLGSAAAALGVGKKRLYDLVASGHVNSVRFRNPGCSQSIILVSLAEIDRLHEEGLPVIKQGRPKKT
jgi:hypothetical protein